MRSLVSRPHEGWLPGVHGLSSLRRVAALCVAGVVLFGCGATTSVVAQQGGGHSATATSTATHATPTNTPIPPPKPTPTNAPTPPKIAGSYGGHYTSYSVKFGFKPLVLQVSQSGSSLSGSSTEKAGAVVTANTGTIALNGTFTITENFGGSYFATLVGSIVGPGHLGGTWNSGGAAQGTWDVYSPPVLLQLSGTWNGTYTNYGDPTNYPMTLHIAQSGSGATFTGTTCEASAPPCTTTTFTDTGTLSENGSVSITESGGGTAYLVGGVTDYNTLSGTWNLGGAAQGTWIVYLLLV